MKRGVRARYKEQRRKRRASLTAEEREEYLVKERERKRKKRASLTAEEREEATAKHAERQRKRRALRTPEEREEDCAKRNKQRRKKRASRTPEEREEATAKQTERQRKWRASRSPEERKEDTSKQMERQRMTRASRTPEEREKDRLINIQRSRIGVLIKQCEGAVKSAATRQLLDIKDARHLRVFLELIAMAEGRKLEGDEHLDHRLAFAHFDMRVRSHQMLVMHHTNLQFLTPLENIRKRATLLPWAQALINDGKSIEDVARLQQAERAPIMALAMELVAEGAA